MIKQPTLDAYRRDLERDLEKKLNDAGRACSEMILQFAGAGQSGGSGMRLQGEDIAKENLTQSMDVALLKCKRALNILPNISESLITATRELMIVYIDNLLTTVIPRIYPRGGDVSEPFQKLRQDLIEQMEGIFDSYEHGFYTPESSMTSNTVHVGSGAVIGNVQLAGDGAQQHGTATINIGAIQKALEEFERALDADTEISAEDKGAIRAEIDTIRPQLRKQQPNPVILREVLKSLRSIVEASASGVLASLAMKLFGGG